MSEEMVIDSEVDSTTVGTLGLETPLEKPAETSPETSLEKPAVETGEQTVPKERLDQALNDLGEMKSRMELMEQNNALAAANQPATTPVQEFDIYKEAGVSENEEDSISVEQHKKTLDYVQKTHQAQIDDLRFHVQNPDFTEIVGTPAQIQQGKFAAPLAAALKENPGLLAQIQSSANPKQAALTIARTASAKSKGSDEEETVVDEAIRNASRPKSVATVKGGSGVSEEHRYSTMTNDAFIKLARSRGANI